jgi:hypothetical protein
VFVPRLLVLVGLCPVLGLASCLGKSLPPNVYDIEEQCTLPPDLYKNAALWACLYKEDADAVDCLFLDDYQDMKPGDELCAYVLRLTKCDGTWALYAKDCMTVKAAGEREL